MALAAANAHEIKQLRSGQTLSRPRGRHGQKECDNNENVELQEGKTDQSLHLGLVIRSQDAVNIVSEIGRNQNVRNGEDSNHS